MLGVASGLGCVPFQLNLGFGVWGLGFWVWGFGFRAKEGKGNFWLRYRVFKLSADFDTLGHFGIPGPLRSL